MGWLLLKARLYALWNCWFGKPGPPPPTPEWEILAEEVGRRIRREAEGARYVTAGPKASKRPMVLWPTLTRERESSWDGWLPMGLKWHPGFLSDLILVELDEESQKSLEPVALLLEAQARQVALTGRVPY